MTRWLGWAKGTALVLSAVVIVAGCSGDDDDDDMPQAGTGDEAGSGGSGSGGSGGSGKAGSGGTGGSMSTGEPDGGEAGSGGSGGAGTGGSGEDSGVDSGTDSGTDSMVPDPCEDVDNACDDEGVSCDGTDLVTCEENDDGCLVATTVDCTEGDTSFCDDDADPAECAACPETDCTEEGTSCGDNNVLVTCTEDDNGCLVEETTDCEAAFGSDFCDADGDPAECAACPATDCTEEGESCDGNDLVLCTLNADGCLVGAVVDCTDNPEDDETNTCEEGGGTAECIKAACLDDEGQPKDDVCVEDETACYENMLGICVDDEDGCPIAVTINCETAETCGDGDDDCNRCDPDALPEPSCVFDPCVDVTNCLDEGEVTCRGDSVITCEEDGNGCLVEAEEDCTLEGANRTCDPNLPTPDCADCANDVGCTVEETRCADNVFERCENTDADSCLELVTEDCGDDFVCDETAGCEFETPPAELECNEELDPAHILRNPGSYGTFDTATETSEYAGYLCPGLNPQYPFEAEGNDILFAIEVPAGNSLNVSLVGATGFTSTGAWMLLLPDCADTGADPIEEACTAYSDLDVSYANESDVTERVYLVVDAEDNSEGTFGLEVATHPLGCGDEFREGSEECDDGNLDTGDGCTPDCELEENYVCTSAHPTVCTLHPTDDSCANVACPALPQGTPAAADVCCTPEQNCGVAYAPVYGNACIERAPDAEADDGCPDATNMFGIIYAAVAPTLQGCCTENDQCGFLAAAGGGCTERSVAWEAMLDGPGRVYYDGPYDSMPCP